MTEEQINQALDGVTGTLVEEPVTISVDINYRWRFQRILAGWGLLPKVREFAIPPLCLGARMLISRELRKVPLPALKDKGMIEVNHILSDEYTEILAWVIAVAILNRRRYPDLKLINFILENFDAADMRTVFLIVLQQLNMSAFVSSTALIKGAGLLENPEIIAGSEESEKNPNTSTPGQSPAA